MNDGATDFQGLRRFGVRGHPGDRNRALLGIQQQYEVGTSPSMERDIVFESEGLLLSGVLSLPFELKKAERRPAVILLHGLGRNKNDRIVVRACRLLTSWGYMTLRFDMRGCGDSQGPRAKVICLEQVHDASSALTFVQSLPQVDPAAIAVMGHGLGAAVALYAAGLDERFAGCISSAGWGNGETKFRRQHPLPRQWDRFLDLLSNGRKAMAEGQSLMVSRADLVGISRSLLERLPPGTFTEFPFEVMESLYRFRPNDVVSRIAPRPLLILHSSMDSVVPTEQSIDIFKHAKMPADLHLVSSVGNSMFLEEDKTVIDILRNWLAKHLPISAVAT
jgi:pimeloyl-ACP methyl ester carboxylesterase